MYAANDGSARDKARKINNRIKHFEEDIADGRHSFVVPTWLTNDGIECADAFIAFTELAATLDDASDDARFLAEGLFHELTGRRKALAASATSPSP